MIFDDFDVVFTRAIVEKLKSKEPTVEPWEVEDAFSRWEGKTVIDDRENNRTNPPTVWFISDTSEGRVLKVVGIFLINKKEFVVKTAYDPDDWEVKFYENRKH